MLKITWSDRAINEEVLKRIKGKRKIWKIITTMRDNMIEHNLRHES